MDRYLNSIRVQNLIFPPFSYVKTALSIHLNAASFLLNLNSAVLWSLTSASRPGEEGLISSEQYKKLMWMDH